MGLINWWHHITDPHCFECKKCDNCEVLKRILAEERINNKKLVDAILSFNALPKEVREETKEEPQPIKGKVTWRMRREMLENEDKAKAESIKNAAQPDSIEQTSNEIKVG